MRILLVNDDGFQAKGIIELGKALAKEHEVIIAAPAENQSGMAHAFTVHRELELVRHGEMEKKYGFAEVWSITGTPTDCVKLYLEAITTKKPDLIFSGINIGSNLGTDVLYSGTVGGAIEGFLHDITSIAVSLDIESEITYAETAADVVEYTCAYLQQQEKKSLLNINFPKKFCGNKPEFVYTQLGHRDYRNAFQRIEREGRVFYRVGGEIYDSGNTEATDIVAVEKGLVSVTPLQLDMTDYVMLDQKLNK